MDEGADTAEFVVSGFDKMDFGLSITPPRFESAELQDEGGSKEKVYKVLVSKQ